jgi:hypothetical protein
MAFEIPKEDVSSITTISTLSRSALDAFVAALEDAPLLANPQSMAARLANQLPSIPPGDITNMVETLYTVYQIRELSGVSHSRFLADFMEAISRHPDVLPKTKQAAKMRETLERLLNIETLRTIAKAARLLRDGERLFCNAKILSDIRPVFGENPALPPKGAVLTHTLKIGYHEGSGHVEFHVVLDSAGLIALADVIKRAQLKDKSLRGLLKETTLPDLEG